MQERTGSQNQPGHPSPRSVYYLRTQSRVTDEAGVTPENLKNVDAIWRILAIFGACKV